MGLLTEAASLMQASHFNSYSIFNLHSLTRVNIDGIHQPDSLQLWGGAGGEGGVK